MTYAMFTSHMKSYRASAHQAEAASSCAHCAAYTAIRVILDAIIVASIIIFALVCLVNILVAGISLLNLALLAVLLGWFLSPMPRKRTLLL
ncbi:hypothetical protein [uncultured Oscillibacter sp.]|uniref:hypothetical protein n=1 Tax=uncultured Oscillibacter sp. TaxID=876091 RepID=UPI0025D27788|nr:hypothetical protein [uncultured Oscillibacter sp.]